MCEVCVSVFVVHRVFYIYIGGKKLLKIRDKLNYLRFKQKCLKPERVKGEC